MDGSKDDGANLGATPLYIYSIVRCRSCSTNLGGLRPCQSRRIDSSGISLTALVLVTYLANASSSGFRRVWQYVSSGLSATIDPLIKIRHKKSLAQFYCWFSGHAASRGDQTVSRCVHKRVDPTEAAGPPHHTAPY
nr:hypothetical protein CFP56_03646 [Quercus suber]